MGRWRWVEKEVYRRAESLVLAYLGWGDIRYFSKDVKLLVGCLNLVFKNESYVLNEFENFDSVWIEVIGLYLGY